MSFPGSIEHLPYLFNKLIALSIHNKSKISCRNTRAIFYKMTFEDRRNTLFHIGGGKLTAFLS